MMVNGVNTIDYVEPAAERDHKKITGPKHLAGDLPPGLPAHTISARTPLHKNDMVLDVFI